MYKAIFIDIDGTLKNNNNKISERTISAINKVIEKGIIHQEKNQCIIS